MLLDDPASRPGGVPSIIVDRRAIAFRSDWTVEDAD
jgi:hypothetical protein